MTAKKALGFIAFSIGMGAALVITIFWTSTISEGDQISSILSVGLTLASLAISILGVLAATQTPTNTQPSGTSPAPIPAGSTTQSVGRDGFNFNGNGSVTIHWTNSGKVRPWLLTAIFLMLSASIGEGIHSYRQPTMPGCDDVGTFEEGYDSTPQRREPWLAAYEAAGGREAIGCPVRRIVEGRVHEWGSGGSQDLTVDKNGKAYNSRLMSLDGEKVVLLQGAAYEGYARAYASPNDAANQLGYPVTDPAPCGTGEVVLLQDGTTGEGALVSTPDGRMIWMPNSAWALYLSHGGPKGELGLPLNGLNKDLSGDIKFENNSILSMVDKKAVIDHDDAGEVKSRTSASPRSLGSDLSILCD